jgi:hypothetical protein
MWHALTIGEIHTDFWWKNVRERTNWDGIDVDEIIKLKFIFKM